MDALSKKIFWLSFGVVGFAVFITCLLLYFKYQIVYVGLQRDRVLMVAAEIDQIAEVSLSLGQQFSEITALQGVLERRRKTDTLFLGIDVIGAEGQTVYSTDVERIGSVIPADWLGVFLGSTKVTYLNPTAGLAVVASPIRNSFDQLSGFALIRYDRRIEHEAMIDFSKRLLLVGLSVLLVFAALLFFILFKLNSYVERTLALATLQLAAIDARASPQSPAQARITTHALASEITVINACELTARHALASVTKALNTDSLGMP